MKTQIRSHFLLPIHAAVVCWMLASQATAQTNGSAQADLAVTLLRFDPQNQGLGFTYTNQGGPLPAQATAKLFWASGTNTIDIITNVPPILTTNIPAGFTGQATNYVAESLLRFPPINANYLLLVLDPDNLLIESAKTNNSAVLRNTFRHVVLVMMENRSFDHLLGWLPNADGKQASLTYTNTAGQNFPTWNLAPYFQGCGCADPDHSFSGGRVEYANGACDGWLRANPNDTFSIGFYLQKDLSFFGQTAPQWTVCDRYFAAIMAETQPNRIYQHAAQTDSLTNREGLALLDFVTLPTIWDTLSQSNVSALYYHAGPPIIGSVLSLWGLTKYSPISAGIDQFYVDCASGTLPAVSFVDPLFTSPFSGDTGGNDDHPHSDVRNGEAFLASIYNAIVSSPNWASTVLIINFDEWGGFFDHVPPPQLPATQIPPDEAKLGNDGRLGFRVPCVVISPWSRNGWSQTGSVNHELFDHTSVLKMIENRWGLPALTVRDANANDLARVLDLDHPNFVPPPVLTSVPPGPFGGPCENLQETRQANGDLVVSWDATCRTVTVQTAPAATGPWSDLKDVSVSPYVLTEAEQSKSAQVYFRFLLR